MKFIQASEIKTFFLRPFFGKFFGNPLDVRDPMKLNQQPWLTVKSTGACIRYMLAYCIIITSKFNAQLSRFQRKVYFKLFLHFLYFKFTLNAQLSRFQRKVYFKLFLLKTFSTLSEFKNKPPPWRCKQDRFKIVIVLLLSFFEMESSIV